MTPALRPLLLAALAAAAGPAPAQTSSHWIIGGTFATSEYAANPDREATYLGASREKKRVLSYLPGMTILYDVTRRQSQDLGYEVMTGLTQSGIPVSALVADVSEGDFEGRDYNDVVVHQTHQACRVAGCDETEKVQVGIGYGFRIEETDGESLILRAPDELRLHYYADELDALEREGVLTRHEGRKYPRFEIVEGYAARVSMPCGQTTAAGTTFEVPRAVYDADPATWALNDDAWSARAMALFGFGLADAGETMVTVELIQDIAYDGPATYALDFTVFAIKDAAAETSEPEFAALLSVVRCEELALGRTAPSYVETAWLARESGQIELPAQLSDGQKETLFREIRRSFLYSFNAAESYFTFFPILAAAVENNHLAAFLVSRLNATCRSSRRGACLEASRYDPVRPVARPPS